MTEENSEHLADLLFAGRLVNTLYDLVAALVSYRWDIEDSYAPDNNTRLGVLLTHGDTAITISLVPVEDAASSSSLLVEALDDSDEVVDAWELTRPDRLWQGVENGAGRYVMVGAGAMADVVAAIRQLAN